MGFIYKIYNDVNSKFYIGQTSKTNPKYRWYQHKSASKNLSIKDTSALHKAMNKYGLEHFYFIIIEEVPNDFLNEREKFWIKFYNSLSPNGYNLTVGGEGALGRKSRFKGVLRPQEVKDKIKKTWTKEKREYYSNLFKGENNPNYGKQLSVETKSKIRNATLGEKNHFFGKHHSEETKQKLSQAQNNNKKQVIMKDKNTGEILKVFESLSAAAKFIHGDDGYISKACRRKTRTKTNIAYGYKWDFIESVSTNCSNEIDALRSGRPQ